MPTLLTTLSARGKLVLGGGAVAAVVLVFAIVSFAKRTSYAPLATELDASASADLTSALKEDGIPYRTGDNGRAVLVARERLDDGRALLAQENLLGGGHVGWEVFDKAKLGTTEFQQRVNYQRALQGEIARAIERIDGVEQATVNLALPEKRLFEREQQPPTASVLLTLDGGLAPAPSQVRGIARLVASAVEGLDTRNVTITDSEGSLLAGAGTAAADEEPGGGKLAAQQAYEQRLEAGLNAMLARVVGEGKATAEVSAELDWDRTHVESETWGRTRVPLTSTSESERYQGSRSAAGGPAGIVGDVPSYAAGGGSSSGGRYDRKNEQTQYAVDKTLTKRELAPGAIKRQSVAVLVDAAVPAAKLDSIRRTVEAAIGYDAARDGVVAVERMPFAADQTAREPAARAGRELAPLVKPGAIAAAAAVFLVVAAMGLRRKQRAVLAWPVAATEPLPAAPGRPVLEPAPSVDDLADRVREQALAREAHGRRELEEHVAEAARANPDQSAQLLRTWLSDR